jgi:membrane-associated protease RseP (regulator of RpoE activity)
MAGAPVRAQQDPVTWTTTQKVTVTVHKDAQAREVQVVVSGSAVTATVDQKDVPESRIVKKDGGKVQVLSESGKEVATVSMQGARGLYGDWRGQLGHLQTDVGQLTVALPRKATLGVQLGEVDESLAAHLDVRPDESILVLSVTGGGAAERAGLAPHDLITRIDGTSPASREKLGEVLATKKAGDTVTLGILRKGAAAEVKVRLADEDLKHTPQLQMLPKLSTYLVDTRKAHDAWKVLTHSDPTAARQWKFDALKAGDYLKAFDYLKRHQVQPPVEKETSDLKADLKDLREQLRQLGQLLQQMRDARQETQRKEH